MTAPLELWGGVECTVNRVGDRYHDQLEWSGHAHRPDDLARIAALGVRRLRYPVLWERVAPRGLAHADWTWADERLGALRALGVEPIVTLTHHGSGVRGSTLLHDDYPAALAEYAGAVAARYPWIARYTPVNEPLTTARFAALYGHWYPHARDDASFARALLAQLRATVLAMRAVRAVRPDALLVQTEDLGRVRGRRALGAQVAFENERRWLTWDVLCGHVAPGHAMWDYLRACGVPPDTLAWHVDHAAPPDVIGVNTYVTSERYLDERVERYPASTRGTDGAARYADVEAVRACPAGLVGVRPLLGETWARYRRPLAVTEAHIGCTREEQIRWLRDVWRGAVAARDDGATVVAVTAWALLGTYNWHNLVTRDDGEYESGAFDARSDPPRPTAVAHALGELADGRSPSHPAAVGRGWWARASRLAYPASLVARSGATRSSVTRSGAARRPAIALLVRDALLVDVVRQVCARRGLRVVPVRVAGATAADAAARLVERVRRARAWAVLDLPAASAVRRSRRASAIERAAGAARLPLLRVTPTFGAARPARARTLHVALATPTASSERLVDDALDLLIDGETGAWTSGPRGPRRHIPSPRRARLLEQPASAR